MENRTAIAFDEALRRLQNYCAYQDRCNWEVKQKLKRMGAESEDIEKIIGQLNKQNYLNEERFTKNFVRGKFINKKWGRQRLTLELTRRQVSKYHINLALSEISPLEYDQTFDRLAENYFRNLKETNKYKKRKKLANYLLYRGWESHLVYNKVKNLIP